ncbi:type II toxin-antitoxin system HicA family toxin [Candidatus Peregrinibacteria bacterium]|nr:type II toxin-antitoxin system HicA family toxin [Candidatus Peregrinibacteria bacterium]
MSDRLPQLKPKEFLRALEKLGFVFRRQTGSHVILRHSETKQIAIVPVHARDIKRGLLFGILKQANISPEELQKVLH